MTTPAVPFGFGVARPSVWIRLEFHAAVAGLDERWRHFSRDTAAAVEDAAGIRGPIKFDSTPAGQEISE